ncbi:hypothetical protein METSCH_B07650 [Metschnikowia aff. pulcherrima]|uniref:Uncharacterized protein n=1 Tax=Metschnikowia aff. pulcherrima TaxID=2163413 RepID=A0A4P6XLC3_9ASCO|nr:hypothetical protein METSCH_B07650 [Metschnikowia aff. pulcherrima]
MLSDMEEEVRPAPKFKAKRKFGGAKRRARDPLEDEVESKTDIGAISPILLFTKATKPASPDPLRVSRWAKYSALGQKTELNLDVTGENGEIQGFSQANASSLHYPLVEQEYTVVDELAPRLESENNAYTKLELPSKTFLLRESHFRDSPTSFIPLDKEYADRYGNVLDEEQEAKPGNDESDHFNEELETPSRDLGDMYDLEVSIEEDTLVSGKIVEILEPAQILTGLVEKLATLEVSIGLKEKKLMSLKTSLTELELARQAAVGEL